MLTPANHEPAIPKVMYGSDGISVPELHWIGSIITRRAFGMALDQMIAAQFVTASDAEDIAHDVFHRTAQRVYRIKPRRPWRRRTVRHTL